jgi:hypothetical protein
VHRLADECRAKGAGRSVHRVAVWHRLAA